MWIIGLAVVLVIAAILFARPVLNMLRIGLSSSFEPRDHDPELTRIADTAKPIITAITQHQARQGQFPSDLSALGIDAAQWHYQVLPSGYVLSKKLGWDPRLLYRMERGRGAWVFDPGDGTPETELRL